MSKVMLATGTQKKLQWGRGYTPDISDDDALSLAAEFFGVSVDNLRIVRNPGAVIVYRNEDVASE